MKLRYIMGLTGSGKSRLCIKEIIEASVKGERALYIVPEQFSLESERLLTSQSRSNVVLGSEVISFAHLAHRILVEVGGSGKKILDEDTKLLILRRVIDTLAKDKALSFYKRGVSRQGFIENISALITEMIRNSVTPEALMRESEAITEGNRSLSDKLKDIANIFSSFNRAIEAEYIARDALLDVLAELIPTSYSLKDTHIWVDSFTDLTAQELKVIRSLMGVCKSLTITFTIGEGNIAIPEALNAFDPFYEAKRSIGALNKLAAEMKLTPEVILLKEDRRHSSAPELEFLTRHYFSSKKYKGECNSLGIYTFDTIEKELEYVCREIYTLIRDKGYSYNDIAVMVSSDKYYLPIKTIFGKNRLPYFADKRQGILFHPLTLLIKSIFDIITTGDNINPIFDMLRCGFTCLTPEEISFIENHCIAHGYQGSMWYEEWKPRYISEDTAEINYLLGEISGLLEIIHSLKNKRVQTLEIAKSLYNIIQELNVPEGLNELIEKAKATEDKEASSLHIQIWDIVWGIIDKICAVMPEDKMTPGEFYRLLETGLQSATAGLIPPTFDSISIAEFNRSRLHEIRALFMLGVNDGIVPPYHADINLLSDRDRAVLACDGCELGGDNLRLINRDRYNIYSYMTKPSERLYLSYNNELNNGMPSHLIKDIKAALDIDTRAPDMEAEDIDNIFTREQAYEQLIKHLTRETPSGEDLKGLYREVYNTLREEGYSERLNKAFQWLNMEDITAEDLKEDVVMSLYTHGGESLVYGVTSIEDYYRCPYMFFLRHGIKAERRREFSPGYSDYGTFIHKALKLFSEKLKDRGLKWNELTDEFIIDSIREITSLDTMPKAGFFRASSTNGYIGNRLRDMLILTIKNISQGYGSFVPYGYEIAFGKDGRGPVYPLSNGKTLELTGSIDKVDLLESGNTTYVKITDYKKSDSSSNRFSPEELKLGIQIQLPLYMDAFIGSRATEGRALTPGGFMYYKVNSPVIKPEESLYKQQLGGGEAVKDEAFLSALTKAEGDNIHKVTSEALRETINRVNRQITSAGNNIIQGKIKAEPVKYKSNSGVTLQCSRCEYSAICRFELQEDKEERYRTLSPED